MNPTTNATFTSTPIFETKNFVNGLDVTTLSDNDLIQVIKKVEDQIADLEKVKTTSKKIGAKKEELAKMLASVVEQLDARP